MKESTVGSSGLTPRMLKSSLRMLCWVFVWAATMVLVDKGVLYGWLSSDGPLIAAIMVNTLIGLGMLMAYMRYLKESDELQRKIQLDALAISFGIGFVGSFTYSLMVTAKYISEAEISDLILLMTISFMATIIIGHIRYR